MPDFNQLRGLRASDRTSEEQKTINAQMGYKEAPNPVKINKIPTDSIDSTETTSSLLLKNAIRYNQDLQEQYQAALAERNKDYGVGESNFHTGANEYINKIADQVSSYYKKYKNTDKLPISEDEYKDLAAQYDAKKSTYGEDHANIWLDNQFKNKVGENQRWWEQAINAVGHLIPAIEGAAIQVYGMVHGGISHMLGAEGNGENPNLNWWDSFINDVIDNPVTRYGRDVEMAGASNVFQGLEYVLGLSDETANDRIAAMKATATKYNPNGIGDDAIVTTEEQDQSWLSSATPWQALQSGGFTAFSMLLGAGEAKVAGQVFNYAQKGAKWMNSTGKIIKTGEALEKVQEGLMKAQRFTELTLIPGSVGTTEGALEGLNTKLEVQNKAISELDEFYKKKIDEEFENTFNNEELNPLIEVRTDQGKVLKRKYDPNTLYREVWKKYEKEYIEAREQIDWASSKAGIHNFWANSLINGMMLQTFKAGLMAPRVQETIRNSRAFGWAYRNPKFDIDDALTTATAKKMSKAEMVARALKEPFGEAGEEYLQSLSSDVFSAAAENNIHEFIENKFNGDGTAKVADSFSSDYAAAFTALTNSVKSKESIESAILGGISSSMGTVGGIGRGYHRDKDGNLVQNSLFSKENFKRSLNDKGELETYGEYIARVTPWRSGLINAYYDVKKEHKEAEETAATITEWLKDEKNREKWDGLSGSAAWMSQMEKAVESNDQFSYRKAQMGKAINDVFMLSKLKGTKFYDTFVADLQRAASMTLDDPVAQDEIQKIRANAGETLENTSDEEIMEKINSNANKMLELMSTVEKEEGYINRLLGRIDDDTKQSLVFGKIMEQKNTERRDRLKEEINTINSQINSSRASSHVDLDDDLKKLILQYGSINAAMKAHNQYTEQKEKAEKKIKELEAIDSDKLSDAQKKQIAQNKQIIKVIDHQLAGLKALQQKDGTLDTNLASLVLNESEIMDLDPITRAQVLASGAAQQYNATHQNRQKIDQLNLEIDEIDNQIEELSAKRRGWLNPNGSIKKRHNKQVKRTDERIAELNKKKQSKMRELSQEQGKTDSKRFYSEEQQRVIENLIQQGSSQDRDFLDKVIDMGRLEESIRDYHTQYQAILSDPKLFQNYVKRVKYKAALDLIRRRARRISKIQDYGEFAQELDRITANASQGEVDAVVEVLREEDEKLKKEWKKNRQEERKQREEREEDNSEEVPQEGVPTTEQEQEEDDEYPFETHFERFQRNVKDQEALARQMMKMQHLTDNDISLLLDAIQYLQSKGVDITNREEAVAALVEADEQGNQGGKFRQYIEAKNDQRAHQQRTTMPVFSSIGTIVGDYVDMLNGKEVDDLNRKTMNPVVVGSPKPDPNAPAATPDPNTPPPPPAPKGGAHTVDGEGTVATGAQAQILEEKQGQTPEGEEENEEELTELQEVFEKAASPQVVEVLEGVEEVIENSTFRDADNKGKVQAIPASQEAKDTATQYLNQLAVNSEGRQYNTIDDLMTDIQVQIETLKGLGESQTNSNIFGSNTNREAAAILTNVYNYLNVQKTKQGEGPSGNTKTDKRHTGWISTVDISYIREKYPESWITRFADKHQIDQWIEDHWKEIDADTEIYYITSSELEEEVKSSMASSNATYNPAVHRPIIAAVLIDTDTQPVEPTYIGVGGRWYQPIAVMPSTIANSTGSAHMATLREKAPEGEGTFLITDTGLPDGTPYTSRRHGANFVKASNPDSGSQGRRDNSPENNRETIDNIINTLPASEQERLRGLSRKELLEDDAYRTARDKFIKGLVWQGDDSPNETLRNKLTFVADRMRPNGSASPVLLPSKKMAETKGRTSDRTLEEVLRDGDLDELINFNTRLKRLYDKVIAPLYQYGVSARGRNARVITKEDTINNTGIYLEEANALAAQLNGYDGTAKTSGIKGVGNFVYVNSKDGWHFEVTVDPDKQVAGNTVSESTTIFDVYFDDGKGTRIKLGEIPAGKNNTDAAKELMRNILWDSDAGTVRDFLIWQIPRTSAVALTSEEAKQSEKDRARDDFREIIDDGLLEMTSNGASYKHHGISLKPPSTTHRAKRRRKTPKVGNPENAQGTSPIDITPKGEGAIIDNTGAQILGDAGVPLEGEGTPLPPVGTATFEEAKRIAKKIAEDSKQFTLAENETHYYTPDGNKWLRVTSVIGADRTVEQYTPPIKDVLDKLKAKYSNSEVDRARPEQFKDLDLSKGTDIKTLGQKLKLSTADVRRAIAELRTVYNEEKYGAWGMPSSLVGNAMDDITRDFLAGTLKDGYPNVSKDALNLFVTQLTLFKNELDHKGITIEAHGIVAHGNITVTDEEGNQHPIKVAGTLDLFGYDKQGNFYIFDMKTTRDHSPQKLEQEKAKWSRQVSLYADLLEQTYGIRIPNENLKIIPLNVSYPAPKGRGNGLSPFGPIYSEEDGQLYVQYGRKDKEKYYMGGINDTNYKEEEAGMRSTLVEGQYNPGRSKLDINWDYLDSVDQDLANALEEQIQDGTNNPPASAASATVDKPKKKRSSVAADNSYEDDELDDISDMPSATPSGQAPMLPTWGELNAAAKGFIIDNYGGAEEYNRIRNENSADAQALQQMLQCFS